MRKILIAVAAAVAAFAIVAGPSVSAGTGTDSYHDLSGVGSNSYHDF